MQERMETQIGSLASKMDANQAGMKAMQAKTYANQAEMKAMQHKIAANLREIIEDMGAWQKEMKADREVTEVSL
jgi:hypothetical protein